jgi:integrase
MIAGYSEDGKRKRLFFETEKKAKEKLSQIKIKLRREGEAGMKIPDWLRSTAMKCTEDLAPFGKTIRDATDHYLKYLRESAKKNITVSALIDQFLKNQEALKRSLVHRRDLKMRLSRFSEKFKDRDIRTIERREIESWLMKLEDLSPQSRHNYWSRLSAFFSYAIKQGFADANPCTGIEQEKIVGAPPEIFSPEQLSKVLEAANSEVLPLLAIGAFAGVRTAELLRLRWDHIRNGHVEVPAAKAKSARRRSIRMSDNLKAWLAPYSKNTTERIWTKSESAFYNETEDCRKAAGLEKWPQNGLRHSFASYHLAKHRNAADLSLDMGHISPHMIFAHYRELVTKEEADKYWNIFPPRPAENVVPMAQRG